MKVLKVKKTLDNHVALVEIYLSLLQAISNNFKLTNTERVVLSYFIVRDKIDITVKKEIEEAKKINRQVIENCLTRFRKLNIVKDNKVDPRLLNNSKSLQIVVNLNVDEKTGLQG